MVRNLVICGAGLVLSAALGLCSSSPPAGVTPVGDASAGRVWGAALVECKKHKQIDDGGCGEDAKPGTNGVGKTVCPKLATWKQDDTGTRNAKPTVVETCYECCYSCGTRTTSIRLCDQKGSGSGGSGSGGGKVN